MNGYRYTHSSLNGDAVRDLALHLCGTPAYLYSQALDAVSLTTLTPEFVLASEGRAFGPQAEVRWQRVDRQADDYMVLVLSEKRQDLGVTWEKMEFELSELQQLYLLGVWQPKEQAWIEVRLPKPLQYPLPGPGKMARPTANAVEYRYAGMVQYLRMQSLQTELLEEART